MSNRHNDEPQAMPPKQSYSSPANASFTRSGPSSSRFGSAASLAPPSPNISVPLSNGETPEPTPCEGASSVGAGSLSRPAAALTSVRSSQSNSSPQPAQQAPPLPYPRPSYPPMAGAFASPSLPMPARSEDRESLNSSIRITERDAPAQVITGIRYRYMPAISKWNQEEIVLRVLHPNRGVSQDTLHVFFPIQLLPERDPNRSLNTTLTPLSPSRGHADPNGTTSSGGGGVGAVDDFDEDSERFIPAFARMFRRNILNVSEDDYFGEAQCQAMTEEFAHIYHRMKLPDAEPGQRRPPLPLLTNRFLVRVPKINIPDDYISTKKGFFSYRTEDTQEVLFLVEPDVSTCDALGVRFPPINAADARVADLADDDVSGEEPYYPRGDPSWNKRRYVEMAEAFSHMTYHLSDRALLVDGLQRTCGYLLDPLVYSKDKKQFGMCNKGLRGISKWVIGHQCNDVCALLKLPPVKRSSDDTAHPVANAAASPLADGDADSNALSPVNTYAAYFNDFAQSLCSVVILPMHRGHQERSRSPMVASPLPQFSPLRNRHRHGTPVRSPRDAEGPTTASTTTVVQQGAEKPPLVLHQNIAASPRRRASPHTGAAGGRSADSQHTPSATTTSAAPAPQRGGGGPHPARLPARTSVTSAGSPLASASASKPSSANTAATTRTPVRVASPRVTRKGPPAYIAASARGGGTATTATTKPITGPQAAATARQPPSTTASAVIRSAPAAQIGEPRKASSPPASANRSYNKLLRSPQKNLANGAQPQRHDSSENSSIPVSTILEIPTRLDDSLTISPASSPNRSKVLKLNSDLRGRETPTLSQTSPRSGGRARDSKRTMSPVSGTSGSASPAHRGQKSPSSPKNRASLGFAATSRERPLATRTGAHPRQLRPTQKLSSTPEPGLRPMQAAPPPRLPASARGVTKTPTVVHTPTSRALNFERQPSGPPLVKQRPFSRQCTTGSLPSTSELATPASFPSNQDMQLSPRRDPVAVPTRAPLPRPPSTTTTVAPSSHPPLAAGDSIQTAAPFKRTVSAAPAYMVKAAPRRTSPPTVTSRPPEAFKRSATDVPIRSHLAGSPILMAQKSPLDTRPPLQATAKPQTTAENNLVTSTPPLLPFSPLRDKPISASSSPPPRPQEPTKPLRSPVTDPLAQTTGGLDIQRQFIFPATKYVYNIEKLEWRRHRTLIRICNPDTGVAQGAMRVCFEVNEVSLRGNGNEVAHVAKMFRRTVSNVVEQDYFTEVEMQCLCAEFARNYNNEPVVEENAAANPRVQMHYVTAVVISFDRKDIPEDLWSQRKGFFSYHTSDTDRCMFSMEPMLIGHFTKYNSNFGEAYRHNEKALGESAAAARLRVFEAAEALSHYSLVRSEGGLLLCDVQGVGSDLTDPEMHTYDGEGLSIGNMGKRGIDRFAQRHRCTDACRTIGLKSLCMRPPKVTPEVLAANNYIKIMHKMRTTFTKCA